MNKSIVILNLVLLSFYASAQVPADYQSVDLQTNGRFYSLYLKFHEHQSNARPIISRDYVRFHLETALDNDSVLTSSFSKTPYIKELTPTPRNDRPRGFLREMLLKLHPGDSASFMIRSVDLYDALKKQIPPFIDEDDYIKYTFRILKTQSKEEVEKDKKQAFFELKKQDEKEIAEYVAKNLPGAKKTFSGIWYKLDYQGEGDFAVKDDVVALNYVGRFLDGTQFGSADQDGQLFEFPVGHNFAIKGIEELILLLRKGAKGTFVIPTYLAYGREGFGERVPPNTPLVFKIEFIDIISRKVIIENKGSILKDEEKKAKDKGMTREEYFEYINKQVEKRKIKGVKFGKKDG